MRHSIWLFFVAIGIGIGLPARAIIAPRHGGPLPEPYFEVKARDAGAFLMTRGWIQKAERVRLQRELYLNSDLFQPTAPLAARYQVSGDFSFPVLLGEFVNQPGVFQPDSLAKELFTGPWPTGTLDEYYGEVSYGSLSISGVVADWVTTFQQDFHYEGASNGLVPNDARTGEFIKELLDANDAGIDFSQYDNDGPDGEPNSGDDDGYVDFIVFVHSESGSECDEFSPNILSHSWVYRGWPISGSAPYTTGDACENGGNILIDDYTIQSGLSCDTGIIEIGSFAHHIGHALGLPDLFDPNGGSSGVGHWDLMGSGYWNTPASPAHLSVWCRKELGWVVPTLATGVEQTVLIPQIETSPTCFELPFTDNLFQRAADCAIDGTYSLRCGLDASEATARGWDGGAGYGNGWTESVEHQFDFDGTVPVTFSYDFSHELEPLADSVTVYITVAGGHSALIGYTGNGFGSESIDISSYLAAAVAPFEYTLEFVVETDEAWSDEDGKHVTTCGAFVVDNVAVTGGGEAYSCDFESSVDGWYQNPVKNPATEYWLVENRQPVGFDSELHNSGLLIWHVDETTLRSALGNSGGTTNNSVRGLVLEEADGVGHLLQDPKTTGNAGDTGDPFPGSTTNTEFSSGSTPNSNNNSDHSTQIGAYTISPSSETMTAQLRAGDPGPVLSAVSPDVVNNDLLWVEIQIDGDAFMPGATVWFTRPDADDFHASNVRWKDPSTLFADFYVYSKPGGQWELHVMNPDGGMAFMVGAVTMVQIVATQLVAAMIEIRSDAVELVFELRSKEEREQLVVSRSDAPSGPWARLAIEPEEFSLDMYRFVDASVEPGRSYSYRLEVWDGGEMRELYRTSVEFPSVTFALEQNIPNPFNPTTTIAFFLPTTAWVALDVFDVSGRLVRSLAAEELPPGRHERMWDGADQGGDRVVSGIYFCKLTAGKDTQTRKMIFLK